MRAMSFAVLKLDAGQSPALARLAHHKPPASSDTLSLLLLPYANAICRMHAA